MYTQDAMPFLYGILLKQVGGNTDRSGRVAARHLKYRDHEGEIARLGQALCMNELETIATLVYLRTLIHNLVYAALSGRSAALDAGHLQSLKYMAGWLDGNIDVFMSLPEEVAEFKDTMVAVSKPGFLSERLKGRVEHGVQDACALRATSAVPREAVTKRGGLVPVVGHGPRQMMQMGDDLCGMRGSTLTMAAPGSRLVGASQQVQWG